MKYRLLFINSVVALIIYLSFPTLIYGQTVSLSVWPPLLEVMLKPGKSITQVYKLTNLGDDTVIKAAVFPFNPGIDGQVIISRVPSPIAGYFSLQNANLTPPLASGGVQFPLKAGTTQELVLKIRAPVNAPEADYYLTFLFESSDLGIITGTGTKTLGSIGSNILLTVSHTGQPVKSGQINQLSALPCLFPGPVCLIDSFSPIKFITQVTNTGTSRFKAIGQLDIFNTFNRKIATLPFREDNVLSNSTRQLLLTSDWNPVFPFGKYKINATITPSDTTISLEKSLVFYILPYKIILLLTLIIIMIKPILCRIKK